MSYSPAQAVANARADVGYREGPNNLNKFTPWQTLGRFNYCAYCASGTSKWTFEAGFRYETPEHAGVNARCNWGERGDWNVGAQHEWAVRQGLWRNVGSYRVQPGDLVVFNFDQPDQHVGLGIADAGANIASIDANTTPGGVFFRSRPRFEVQGAIALTQSRQAAQATIPTPKEIRDMGMTAASLIPGARMQTKAPWKDHRPFIGAILHPGGSTDLVGFNGVEIVHPKAHTGDNFSSVLPLGKLKGQIRAIGPEVDTAGNWRGRVMVGMAEDQGSFAVQVKVHYL